MLGGCIANVPDDLALESVQLVDWRDQDELPGPGAFSGVGIVSRNTLALMGMNVVGGEKPPKLFLKVEFTSATNLSKFVKDNGYNLGVNGYICNRSPEDFAVASDVYWQGHLLGLAEEDPIGRVHKAAGERITYYFFVHVHRDKFVVLNKPREGFDLRKRPQDVCFYVSGGGGGPFGYKSNVVAVPRAAVEMAVQKLPPGFE